MSDFKAKMHRIRFLLAFYSLGEFTALPQTSYLYLRGPTSNGEGGERGRGGEGKGRRGG